MHKNLTPERNTTRLARVPGVQSGVPKLTGLSICTDMTEPIFEM